MSKSIVPSENNGDVNEEIAMLKQKIVEMGHENEEQLFFINTLKATVRLLRDTLKKVQKASKKAISDHDRMDELAESRMETGAFKQFLEKEIKYPGEETLEEYQMSDSYYNHGPADKVPDLRVRHEVSETEYMVHDE